MAEPGVVRPSFSVEMMVPLPPSNAESPPGAAMSTLLPVLLYDALRPVRDVAATVITLSQLAGEAPVPGPV